MVENCFRALNEKRDLIEDPFTEEELRERAAKKALNEKRVPALVLDAMRGRQEREKKYPPFQRPPPRDFLPC